MAFMFMCFLLPASCWPAGLLACALLDIDTARAACPARNNADPEMSMKAFLSERG